MAYSRRQHISRRFGFALILASLAACAEREPMLPGQRFDPHDIDAAQDTLAAAVASGQPIDAQPPAEVTATPITPYGVTGQARGISLGGQQANANWTHVNGSPAHDIAHPALGPALTEVWSASIGTGNSRKGRITADPVVGGGRVFTMDSLSDVRAFSTSGQLLWQRNLTPPRERAGEADGGGLAYDGNRVYVTTGYGGLHALDAASGAVVWTQKLGVLASSAPTVSGGIVYLTTRDGMAYAIKAGDGRILWDLQTTETGAVTINGAAPAVSGKTVLFPFGSGEVIAALKTGGLQLWTTYVAGQRTGRAYATISDISSDPVIVGNRAYVGTPSGRLAAIDMDTGERLWTAKYGASSPVWPAGGSVFLVSDQADLVRLDAGSGEVIWSASLPLYTVEKIKSRDAVFAHYGPVLAGGRLIVVSDDGLLRQVDPVSGRLLGATELPGRAAANPVVAGRTLYVVTADGTLHAFR